MNDLNLNPSFSCFTFLAQYFTESYDLSEMSFANLISFTNELKVARNARFQKRTVVLTLQVAVPIRIVVVDDGNYVDVEPCAAERDRDTVRLWLYLFWFEVGERIPKTLS